MYGENSDIILFINIKAEVVFGHNVATAGGAVYLTNGTMNIGIQSNVVFAYNLAHVEDSGALLLSNELLHIDSYASVSFSHNSA